MADIEPEGELDDRYLVQPVLKAMQVLQLICAAAEPVTLNQLMREAGLPKTTVLAGSNLGTSILAYSPHRALAGPYHRNIPGNLATLDAFTGPVDAARKVIQDRHVGLIAICHADAEQRLLASKAPAGLLARLLRDDPPAWLEPIGAGPEPLRLYRVR